MYKMDIAIPFGLITGVILSFIVAIVLLMKNRRGRIIGISIGVVQLLSLPIVPSFDEETALGLLFLAWTYAGFLAFELFAAWFALWEIICLIKAVAKALGYEERSKQNDSSIFNNPHVTGPLSRLIVNLIRSFFGF